MEANLVEVLTSLGGGAAVTAVAWTLLYLIWKRFEVANQARIDDLMTRAHACETDRQSLRAELMGVSMKLHDLEHTELQRMTVAIEQNTAVLEGLKGACPAGFTHEHEKPGRGGAAKGR